MNFSGIPAPEFKIDDVNIHPDKPIVALVGSGPVGANLGANEGWAPVHLTGSRYLARPGLFRCPARVGHGGIFPVFGVEIGPRDS